MRNEVLVQDYTSNHFWHYRSEHFILISYIKASIKTEWKGLKRTLLFYHKYKDYKKLRKAEILEDFDSINLKQFYICKKLSNKWSCYGYQ